MARRDDLDAPNLDTPNLDAPNLDAHAHRDDLDAPPSTRMPAATTWTRARHAARIERAV